MVNEKDRGKGIENARKEAISDGIKRALRHFGHALGLGVYDKRHSRTALRPSGTLCLWHRRRVRPARSHRRRPQLGGASSRR